MDEHDNHRDVWPLIPGAFLECMTQGYVAIIRDSNHSMNRDSKDNKEITLFGQ